MSGVDQDASAPPADPRVEAALDSVERLVTTFLFDLGELIAGRVAYLEDYLDADLCTAIRATLAQLDSSGPTLQPDFGDWARVEIEGDLLGGHEPILAQVDIADRCRTPDADGADEQTRRIRIDVDVDPTLTRITDVRFHNAEG